MSSVGGAISGLMGSNNDFNATAKKDTFHADQANLDQTNYDDAIRASLAATQASQQPGSAVAGQNAFAQALQAQMNGSGPSLAQRQLETATQQNASQAAGALASAKGINPALAARMIAQNTAAGNQAAAGQAATLRQSEQLNTEGMLGSALQAQRSGDIAQQQANTQGLATVGGLQQGNNALTLQNVQGTNQINAGVSAGNANRDLQAQGINAGVAAQNAQTNGQIAGGLMSAAGAGLGVLAMSDERVKTDIVRHPDEVIDGVPRATFEYKALPGVRFEGVIAQDVEREHPELVGEGASGVKGVVPALAPHEVTPGPADFTRALLAARGAKGFDLGGYVAPNTPAVVVPDFLSKDKGGGPAVGSGLGSMIGAAMSDGGPVDFRAGGRVPGRATVPGDDPRNDTVPAMVSPGEIVLPRTVTQAPDAEDRAAEFVKAIRAKKKEPTGYGRVLEGQRALATRLSKLERMANGGEVKEGGEDSGILERVKRWWESSGSDSADAGKAVADKIAASTPVISNTRQSIRSHNAALQAALDAAGGN